MELESLFLNILTKNFVYLIDIELLKLSCFFVSVFWWFASQEIYSFHLSCWIYGFRVVRSIFLLSPPHDSQVPILRRGERVDSAHNTGGPGWLTGSIPQSPQFLVESGKVDVGKKFHYTDLASTWFLFCVCFC